MFSIYKDNTINILFCFDDSDGNYARHCAVAMLSILETNKLNKIKFYIISTCLSVDSIKELERITYEYNQEIEFIIRDNIIPEDIKLLLINRVNLTRGTWYRLFFNLYIKDVDRILYLDCDTIVVNDLSKIFNMDIKGKAIAGYIDNVISTCKEPKLDTNNYINAGVLLIDAKKYGMYPITEEKLTRINMKYGEYLDFADQDYLNVLYKDEILVYEIGMNYMLGRIFLNKGIKNATILHCIAKPYLKYTLCPKSVVNLYYKHLNITKWKGFPKVENSIGMYFSQLFHVFVYYCVGNVFGKKGILLFSELKISKILHKLFSVKFF